jgi:hypothetical protein
MNKGLIIGVVLTSIVSLTAGIVVSNRTMTPPTAVQIAETSTTPTAPTAQQELNTFTPPTGRAKNPAPNSAGERRVNIATSSDGFTFIPTGNILTDQANVPDAVVTTDGKIFVYYTGSGIRTHEENLAVAISEDNGKTWTYHLPTLSKFTNFKAPADPDVVLLEDGTFRMYYTSDFGGSPLDLGIRYADSDDGLAFTYKGIALNPSINVIDSTTFFLNGEWIMVVLDHKEPRQYRATSTDGITFTLEDDTLDITTNDGGEYILSNPIPSQTPLTLLGFGDPQHNALRAFSTEDGRTWTPSTAPSLEPTASALNSGTYLQDVTIAQISDGSYLLFYVTDIPKE